jgi:hypothetical protein
MSGATLLDSLLGRVGMGWGWKGRAGGLRVLRRGRVGRRGFFRAKRERGPVAERTDGREESCEHYSRLVDYLLLNKTKPGDRALPEKNVLTFFRIDTNL